MMENNCRCNELEKRIVNLEKAKNSTDDYKSRMGKKIDNIEEWSRELSRQQTQQSINIAVLKTEMEQQKVDREEKHKAITDSINELKRNIKLFIEVIEKKVEDKAEKKDVVALQNTLEVVSFFSKHPKLVVPMLLGLYIMTFDEVRKPVFKALGLE